ncbi:hypothetical protein [Chryseobacterium sp.]|uniref:hypothetical protein n=1 Tax=Chryseobacterium sp. TaxID=1871047 RepID=UPI0025BA3F74|nr:hypothetical protein [Chryseobacterium sp.]MBV8325500.1 hypothetical protein [Chryseobacterium sp.]
MAFIILLIGIMIIRFKLSSKENVFNIRRDNGSMYDRMLYYRGWIAAVMLILLSLAMLVKEAADFFR